MKFSTVAAGLIAVPALLAQAATHSGSSTTANFDDLPVDMTPPADYHGLNWSSEFIVRPNSINSLTNASSPNVVYAGQEDALLTGNSNAQFSITSFKWGCIADYPFQGAAVACELMLVSGSPEFHGGQIGSAGPYSFSPHYRMSENDTANLDMQLVQFDGYGIGGTHLRFFLTGGIDNAQLVVDDVVVFDFSG